MNIPDEISSLAVDIVNLGRMNERKAICEFLTKCANDLNFGKDSPNDVLLEIVKIIKEQP